MAIGCNSPKDADREDRIAEGLPPESVEDIPLDPLGLITGVAEALESDRAPLLSRSGALAVRLLRDQLDPPVSSAAG